MISNKVSFSKNNSFNHRSIKIMPLLYKSFQPILSQNSMKYTYIKAQFRTTRYVFVCQISAAHVVIVLNTLLQKCVDDEHYLWISSQVQVGVTSKASKAQTKHDRAKHLSGRSKNTCLLLQQASYSNLIYTGIFEHPNKHLVFPILSRLSNQTWKKVKTIAN